MLEASPLNPWIAWISCFWFAVDLLVLTKGGKIPRGDHAGGTKGDPGYVSLCLVLVYFNLCAFWFSLIGA